MLTLNNLEGTSPIHAGSGCIPELFSKGTRGTKDAASVILNLIPGENDRPKFVVLNDWHEEGASKYRPGVWHFGIKPGRGEAPPTLTQQWICSPLPGRRDHGRPLGQLRPPASHQDHPGPVEDVGHAHDDVAR